MKKCTNCGTEYDSNFCPNCGHCATEHSSTTPLEAKSTEEVQKSNFSATVFGWFGVRFLVTLGTIFSFGIALPWLVCFRQKYLASRTHINGKTQRFDGNGVQLIGKYLLWLLLTILTCGIGAFFLKANLHKWIVSHTHFTEETEETEQKSYYDGTLLMYMVISAVSSFVKTITLGFASPWMHCWKERYLTNHSVIDGHRLDFDGTGLQLYGKKFLWGFLTVITLGIFSHFQEINMKKWTTRHTNLEELVLEQIAKRKAAKAAKKAATAQAKEKKKAIKSAKNEELKLRKQDPLWKKAGTHFCISLILILCCYYLSPLLLEISFIAFGVIIVASSIVEFIFALSAFKKANKIKRTAIKVSSVFLIFFSVLYLILGIFATVQIAHQIASDNQRKGFNFTLENGNEYSVSLDENSSYFEDLIKSEYLEIPSEYNGLPVTKITGKYSDFWKDTGYINNIEKVFLPESIKTIGDGAFAGWANLTDIEIPKTVTAIDGCAFENCVGLKSITLPDNISSIGYYAFAGCTGLSSITIPKSVIIIGDNAFKDCTSVTEINFNASHLDQSFDTNYYYYNNQNANPIFNNAGQSKDGITINIGSSVTVIPDGLFKQTTMIKEVNFTPDSICTSIGSHAFSGCIRLTEAIISDSVTSLGYGAFSECIGLKSITIPSAKFIHEMFIGDFPPSLTSIVITNTSKIDSYAFANLTQLTSITLPEKLTTIGDSAFEDCSGLESITIPQAVTSIGNYAFRGCSNLTEINLNASNFALGSYPFEDCGQINTGITVNIGSTVTAIPDYMFYGANIKNVSFSKNNSCTSIGVGAFLSCSNLTSIILPKELTTIGISAFEGCSGLTNIVIPDDITTINNSVFRGCINLKNINIPSKVTHIGAYAFSECKELTDINLPENIISIGNNAFEYCSKLTIKVPKESIDIGWDAFYGCYNVIYTN